MYDINFFMKAKKSDMTLQALEEARSKEPIVFNIETTNLCPMVCPFCARTTKMIRRLHTMDLKLFEKVTEELKPHSSVLWHKWRCFVRKTHKIQETRNTMTENYFYLFVSSKCVTLHGYGEPILDKTLAQKVQLLSDRRIPSYFSMNPANINLKHIEEIFEARLGYLKFSVDSVYDMTAIRGAKSKFLPEDIYRVIDRKNECGYKTKIVLTMLDLEGNKTEHEKFMELYKDKADFIYIKSMDNRWLGKEKAPEQRSVHWNMPCLMPWSSLTVLSRGYVVPCHQIYNVELVLGDIKYESLSSIWNSKGYKRFREAHFTLNKDIIEKCVNRCDMQLVGE